MFDYIIFGVRDLTQKDRFEKLLKKCNINYLFECTVDGKNKGSGNGFLMALPSILSAMEKYNSIIYISVGGMSKRMPNSFINGKIFQELPLIDKKTNKFITYFEFILEYYGKHLNEIMKKPFLLFSPSDVIITGLEKMDFTNILMKDDIVQFIAMSQPTELINVWNHGIFIGDENKNDKQPYYSKVNTILQKPSYEQLKNKFPFKELENEIYWIDGLVIFNKKCIEVMSKFFFKNINTILKTNSNELCFYSHLMRSITNPIEDLQLLLESKDGYDDQTFLLSEWKSLFKKNENFQVMKLPKSQFYHIGTIKEFHEFNEKCIEIFNFLNLPEYWTIYSQQHFNNLTIKLMSNSCWIEHCEFIENDKSKNHGI
ncbi:hypothetical protein SNEBB_010776 [Seison nebaliae]|nr:hypothetical protein SNEBB_010776 [Seison nebaliae]